MGKGDLEGFMENWGEIMENLGKVTKGVGAIGEIIAKKIQPGMKAIDSVIGLIQEDMGKYELKIKHIGESVKGISDVFADKVGEIDSLPEGMTKDIGEFSVKLGKSLEPVVKLLDELRERLGKY